MKTLTLFFLLAICLIFIQSCGDNPMRKPVATYIPPITEVTTSRVARNTYQYNNTKGYAENGKIITEFDCPDSKFFPPIDLKAWDKIPVVNGRFPTYAETMDGTSIHHYGEKENPAIKPYDMPLPKLAYRINTHHRTEFENKHQRTLADLVVVIQVVRTVSDTLVGFRYLTGGCGGSVFRDFHFLTDDEVKKVVGQ
jgi:hypothetical protein